MKNLLIITLISIFLTIHTESLLLILQRKGKYIKNPLDMSLWAALIGLAFWTGSINNLIIAGVFILVMTPHIRLKNKQLR